MNIVAYNLSVTNDFLTSRAGLVCIAKVMQSIKFSALVNKAFPKSKSNRGYEASAFVESVVLMLHEGGIRLDDLEQIRTDTALRKLLGLKQVPASDSLGDWLRRQGEKGVKALIEVNRVLIKKALHNCKEITLDIDATLIKSGHKEAKWSYKKCKGYMPMAGHIAETGQVIGTDFRLGNISPATENAEFIKQCESNLPEGVKLKKLRIDAAGYQVEILDDCIDRGIQFAIRAKMSQALKQLINEKDEAAWEPMLNPHGEILADESTCRVVHAMNHSQQAFEVVIQRKRITGQQNLEVSGDEAPEEIEVNGFIYRGIATNHTELSNNEVIHWYNQRGEHSENRIKELKNDFGAAYMPCKQFAANALYFSLCSIAYNLFILMRSCLPADWENCRAKKIRLRLYAMAGKVTKHGRKWHLKLQAKNQALLSKIITLIRGRDQAP